MYVHAAIESKQAPHPWTRRHGSNITSLLTNTNTMLRRTDLPPRVVGRFQNSGLAVSSCQRYASSSCSRVPKNRAVAPIAEVHVTPPRTIITGHAPCPYCGGSGQTLTTPSTQATTGGGSRVFTVIIMFKPLARTPLYLSGKKK